MDRIIQGVRKWAEFEPLDSVTVEEVRQFLAVCYPEARWLVWIENGQLEISALFDSEEDRTFYMLKWS